MHDIENQAEVIGQLITQIYAIHEAVIVESGGLEGLRSGAMLHTATREKGKGTHSRPFPFVYLSTSPLPTTSLRAAQARVQGITQPVTQEIESEHGDCQGQRRENGLIGVSTHHLGTVRDHRAPRRRRWVNPQANE